MRRATTQKQVGKQVLLNLLLIGTGSGAAFRGFSKDELEGETIELAGDRGNLANPVPTAFVTRLNTLMAAAIQADPSLAQRAWRNPVHVASGHARLLYQDLDSGTEERFKLTMELTVYKRKENVAFLSFSPDVSVDCTAETQPPLPLADWSEGRYQRVRTEMDAMLSQCEHKVMAALPDMLKQ